MSDTDGEEDVNLPSAAECDERCKMFAEITGTDTALAMFYLQDREWNLDRSVNAYFEDQGGSSSSVGTKNSLEISTHTTSLPSAAKRIKTEEMSRDLGSTGSDSLDAEPHRIRLISWNIDGLDKSTDKRRTKVVCEIINRENPHVVFLQEVTPTTIPIIEAHCPTYQVVPGGHKEYFTAILLKVGHVEFEESRIIDFPNTVMSRNLLNVKCKVKGIPFDLMTSHLESMKDYSDARKEQLKTAFKYMSESVADRTVIFGGDMNLRDKELLKLPKGLVDLWVDTGSRHECRYTWDMTRNTNLEFGRFKARLRFDRLYMRHSDTPTVKAVYFELIGLEKIQSCGKFPSDHWGLLTHFDIISKVVKF